MKLATSLAVLVVTAAGAYASSASAQVAHATSANAVAHCQGSLPSFEGAIRKRPLGMANTGTTPAFLSCSFEAESQASDTGVVGLDTYFFNSTNAEVALTCTAVSGFQGGTTEFVSKTTTIPANSTGNPFWDAAEFTSGLGDGLISINCALPPGVEANDSYVSWSETVSLP